MNTHANSISGRNQVCDDDKCANATYSHPQMNAHYHTFVYACSHMIHSYDHLLTTNFHCNSIRMLDNKHVLLKIIIISCTYKKSMDAYD